MTQLNPSPIEVTRRIIIMQAWIDGKSIEYSYINTEGECDIWEGASSPCWDWVKYGYRIKEKQKSILNQLRGFRDSLMESLELILKELEERN